MPIDLTYGRQRRNLIEGREFACFVIVPLFFALCGVIYFHHGWFTQPILLRYRQTTAVAGTAPITVLRNVGRDYDFIGVYRYETLVPRQWKALVDAGLPVDEPPVYIGLRKLGKGPERLVVVTSVPPPPSRTAQLIGLRAWVFEPGTVFSPPRRIWRGPVVLAIKPEHYEVRLYAGVADVRSSDLFEIEYRLDSEMSDIDGKLLADDTIELILPPVPVAAPRGPLILNTPPLISQTPSTLPFFPNAMRDRFVPIEPTIPTFPEENSFPTILQPAQVQIREMMPQAAEPKE